MSSEGLVLARTLRRNWPCHADEWRLFGPQRLVESPEDAANDITPFISLRDAIAQHFRQCHGHVFVGACGIAVRAIAPLLRHKSMDPAVVVLDTGGHFAISLVSGHLGGANELARQIAKAVGGTPVVTTASDTAGLPSLDMVLQECGLRVVDWPTLPRVQAALLEGKIVALWDPHRALWPLLPQALRPLFRLLPDSDIPSETGMLQVAIDWRQSVPAAGRLRVALPCLTLGIGCRKGIAPATLREGVDTMLEQNGIEREAIAALATVTEKATEAALQQLTQEMNIPLLSYDAALLAKITTPNPSPAAGKRFGTRPFSVCEAAALAGSGQNEANGTGRLIVPKNIFAHACTLAVGMRIFHES